MYALMICFIAVVLIIGIFCVTVVTRDIVLDERRKKSTTPVVEDKPQAEVAAEPVKESAPTVVAAPVEEPVAEQEKEPEEVAIEIETDTETAAAEEETADEDGRVNFSTGTKRSTKNISNFRPNTKAITTKSFVTQWRSRAASVIKTQITKNIRSAKAVL